MATDKVTLEDFILDLLGGKKDGKYIHLGCGDAIKGNTLALSKHGWSGIGVDLKGGWRWGWENLRKHVFLQEDAKNMNWHTVLDENKDLTDIDFLCVETGNEVDISVVNFPWKYTNPKVVLCVYKNRLTTPHQKEVVRRTIMSQEYTIVHVADAFEAAPGTRHSSTENYDIFVKTRVLTEPKRKVPVEERSSGTSSAPIPRTPAPALERGCGVAPPSEGSGSSGEALEVGSMGKLLDMFSVLTLKKELIREPEKNAKILAEWTFLKPVADKYVPYFSDVYSELHNVNRTIWDINENIATMLKANAVNLEELGMSSVRKFKLCGTRTSLKCRIDFLAKSTFTSEKSY